MRSKFDIMGVIFLLLSCLLLLPTILQRPPQAIPACTQHSHMLQVMIIIGTRPELIKLSPVIHALRNKGEAANICLTVLSTGQHADMLSAMLSQFNVEIDIHLSVMRKGQSLSSLSSRTLSSLDTILSARTVDILLVQGDTTTAMAGALTAFQRNIIVGHVEAGLRTYNLDNPFPEEMNRQSIGLLACRHYAPTPLAKKHLLAEWVHPESILVTGNTGIDAAMTMSQQIPNNIVSDPILMALLQKALDKQIHLIYLTIHRRENLDAGLDPIFDAIETIIRDFPTVRIIFPVHPNPNVQKAAQRLRSNPHIHMISPTSYFQNLHMLKHTSLLITDSGGLQEEATVFHIPTLVLRAFTERPESIDAGISVLVGRDPAKIIHHASLYLSGKATSPSQLQVYPYGYGNASEYILNDLKQIAEAKTEKGKLSYADICKYRTVQL